MSATPSFGSLAFERSVTRISDPTPSLAGMPGRKARRLIDTSDLVFTDPFLVMAEDWMPHGAFAVHPHRGIETVTYVVEGAIEHADDSGNRGLVEAGGAQWMTAGRGVLHEENALPGTMAHTLQLWVNLPAALKMTAPRYQDLVGDAMPTLSQGGVEIKIFSGAIDDVAAETLNHVPVLMLEIRLRPHAATRLLVPATDNAFVFVIDGSMSVGPNGVGLRAGQLGWLTRSDEKGFSWLRARSGEAPCRFLLFSGPPLREPVVFGGPFVMNTKEEVQQAFRDFANQRF